ncbi:beta-ketoacyl-ACP synthase 3 [bacterium]|nr:beta-ketoacyl-ACP synthase 3 [bacterium]
MSTRIAAIEYSLPGETLGNETLAALSDRWTPERIRAKTGIDTRRIVAKGQSSADLAVEAATKLFESSVVSPAEIDFILLCTQTPDYFLPTTACLLQERLGIPTTAGALDFNLGCSGFIYGLGLAHGLIESGQARNILLLTAETYTRFIGEQDLNVRTIFGDAAAATLVQANDSASKNAGEVGPFVYGTDGRGAENLIVRQGAFRAAAAASEAAETEAESEPPRLFMDGPEIFVFTLTTVPLLVESILTRTGLTLDQIDRFVFHQANGHMLEHLRSKMDIPPEKFVVEMSDCGNTVSSTIPIALKRAAASGQIQPGQRLLLVGFGVGYSWGAALVRWNPATIE